MKWLTKSKMIFSFLFALLLVGVGSISAATPIATALKTSATTSNTVPQVQPFKDSDTYIQGTAEPNAQVKLLGSNPVLSTRADSNGNFQLQPGKVYQPNTMLTLQFIDSASHIQQVTFPVLMRDASANPVRDIDHFVTGKAEPSATVTVSTNSAALGTATVRSDGTFSVAIKAQPGGEYLFLHVNKGKYGVTDQFLTLVVADTTAPAAPKIVRADNAHPSVDGTAEPYSIISITDSTKQVIGSDQTDINGNFSVQIPQQSVGAQLSVTATDSAGNVSTATVVTVVNINGPTVPTLDPVTDTSTKVTGHADPFNSVAVEKGTLTLSKGTVDGTGSFALTIPKQTGNTVLSVVVTDSTGRSVTVKITVRDTTPPAIPSVNAVHSYSTTVTGTAEANATIQMTTSTGQTYTGTVDRTGRFSIPITALPHGATLTVTATDAAGNTSQAKIVTVQ